MVPRKRTFVPASRFIRGTLIETAVDRWEWSRGRGLVCFCKDGMKFKSDYTLRELLAAERPVEVKQISSRG